MAWLTVLGIPAALYVTSMTVLFFFCNHQQTDVLLNSGVLLLTMGIYIFHRSSIDKVEPMQERHLLACEHRRILRLISTLSLLSSIVVLAMYHPASVLLVVAACIGVIVYGQPTLTKPVRLFLFLKPLAVGFAIALFAWALLGFSGSIVTLVAFALMCSADAFLCDRADVEYDRATGCQTLAAVLGERWTWIVSLSIYSLASIVLLYLIEHLNIGLFFFIVFILSLSCRKLDLRSIVDLRPVVVLLLAWVEWMFWIGQLQ